MPASLPAPPCDWQTALSRAIRDPQQLLERLGLAPAARESPSEISSALAAAPSSFPTLVPLEFLERMRPGDPDDPLLLQVLPRIAERLPDHEVLPPGALDVVGDHRAHAGHGLLRKYRGRALLVVSGHCAAHCRYCFRQHFDYSTTGPDHWRAALSELARSQCEVGQTSVGAPVEELILSGGDPLLLSDSRWLELTEMVTTVPGLKRLRIHTRLPILIPQRITDELLGALVNSPLQTWWVVHVNHAQELDATVATALRRIQHAGFPVLNQAVLLRGVNDSVAALRELSLRLVDLGVAPYYLHQLDPVANVRHFRVSPRNGRRLLRALQDELPGYAVPTYVQEVAGEAAKVRLMERSAGRDGGHSIPKSSRPPQARP